MKVSSAPERGGEAPPAFEGLRRGRQRTGAVRLSRSSISVVLVGVVVVLTPDGKAQVGWPAR
jgi:hypothetical protein